MLAALGGPAYGDFMTNDPGLSRRVTRLENDTESLYELVTDVRTTQDEHTRRFEGIDSTLAEHTRRFEGVDSTLAEHTRRFDRVETTLAEVVRRLPEPS